MLKKDVNKLGLPPLRSAEEMSEILQDRVYGHAPSPEYSISATEPKMIEKRYAKGEVAHTYVDLTISANGMSHTLRVDRLLHNAKGKRPLVIFINFKSMSESPYFPVEEMSEYNVDFLSFCYKDATSDDSDMTDKIAPMLRASSQCGKIAMWAWTASRVLDYGLTLEGTDEDNLAVAGHSRLGKTALYAAMTDKRFKYAFSNASGCLGASLAHVNATADEGRRETYRDIYKNFPFWFSPAFEKYKDADTADEFDMHYLIGAIAPRFVLVGSCSLDAWANPRSEQLCCSAASDAWEKLSYDGFICDKYAEPWDSFLCGRVGYFMIDSMHFMSRHSWRYFMDFIEAKKDERIYKD